VASLASLVRPGGDVICSTLNRNAKSFALAIVGAEYLLRLLPMGTHQYARLIRPSEISLWARNAGLELADLAGIEYNPATRKARIGADVSVNYLVHFKRPATAPTA
jgi:2-polyprenyl-6-hydroxyphenyl methylase/3-demethylubiquinone-9 3-methyltransferase